MKFFLTKLRAHSRRIGSAVLVFGLAAAVLAWFMGAYDISFLDREELLGKDHSSNQSGETGAMTESESAVTRETDPAQTDTSAPADTTEIAGTAIPPNTGSTAAVSREARSVVDIINTDLLSDKVKTYANAGSLTKSGYAMTTADWTDGMRLAKMQFTYKLPSEYSVNTRTVEKTEYVYPENESEYYAATVQVTEERPAIELYMGNIFYDRGDELFFINKDGTALFTFDDTVTRPAYCRDINGNPLYLRNVWEDGELVQKYFRLADNGSSFIESDYDEVLHDRGLRFDYPSWYGLADTSALVRMQEEEEMVTARLEEEAQRVAELTEEELLAEEEERKLNKTVVFNAYENQRIAFYKYGEDLTGYIFRQAYNFQSGFAAVTADENRQEMYFLNEYGRKALSGYRMYLKTSYERYVIESWRLPASWGIESIGSLYFDHGLVRVRKQTIDNWAYMTYDNIRVISDEEILIDRTGKEFPIPAGYTLKAYSCGMLLLEKDGKVGFMDYTGAWIAEPVYADATPFINNLATLTTSDGRVGMIDTEGNIVLAFAYKSISQASSGLVASYREEDGWVVYKIMSK